MIRNYTDCIVYRLEQKTISQEALGVVGLLLAFTIPAFAIEGHRRQKSCCRLQPPLAVHSAGVRLFQIGLPELGDSQIVGIERAANQLAANPDS